MRLVKVSDAFEMRLAEISAVEMCPLEESADEISAIEIRCECPH
jgi:hypothetical protein